MSTDWLTTAAAVVLVGLFGATIGSMRNARPMLATRVLMTLSWVVATALAVTLVVLALPMVGRSDLVADRAQWSDAVFARGPAPALTVSVLATLALVAAVLRAVLELRGQMRDKAAASRFRQQVGAAYGETVVVAIDEAEAMALSSGVIIMSSSLIRVLDAAERRAVLAHERAHLDHRHHRYRRSAALIAAANPLLHRLPEAIWYLTERWADEEAARATCRATTATALHKVARITNQHFEQSLTALRSATVGVPERVLALQSEPRRLHWYRVISLAALVVGVVAVAFVAAERTLDVFQLARAF